MSVAFEQLFGIPRAFEGLSLAGKTDSWLLGDALAHHRIAPDDARVAQYRDIYLRYLPNELNQRPPGKTHGVMPGVRALLDALASRPAIYLALLTGNYQAAARMKLEYFDLWKYFPCGAFGDEAPDRNGLLPKAIDRVRMCGGPAVAPGQTVIIGDTPLDIAVAVAGGARSIGVATGSSGVDELRAAGADVVFQNLSDVDAVLAALESPLQ